MADTNFQDDNVDLGQIIRLILMQSKLIALVVFLITGLSILNYIYSDRVYRLNSLLQVYADKSANLNNNISLDFIIGGQNTSDIMNVGDLYLSRSNIVDVIKDKKLFLRVDGMPFEGFEIFETFEYGPLKSHGRKLMFNFAEGGYELFNQDGNKLGTYEYDKEHTENDLKINVKKLSIFSNNVTINVLDPEQAYLSVMSRFKVNNTLRPGSYYGNRGSGLIEVSYVTKNRKAGVEILNYANNLFINKNIQTESETARKAIDFIDDRLAKIEMELEEDKSKLKSFRELNKTVDVDLEIQSVIDSIATIELKINEIDLEIAKASNNYTQSNPLYLELLNQKDALVSQRLSIENKIKSFPVAQQEYIDLFRDLELTQQIYSDFMTKRIEFSITEASTIGNIRIVDDAYYQTIISPRLNSIFYTFCFTLIISLILAIFRGLFFIPITNPAEIADRKINNPIIGVVPSIEGEDTDENSERFSQAIESIVVNINTIKQTKGIEGSTTILMTSPTEKNGKSFLSREIARKISSLGKKVILIDNDLKRGDQHKDLGKNKISLKDFNNLNIESLESLKISENFYLVPKITQISSSFQFFYSPEYQEKIKLFKENFDYVIIDTAPLLSVSDTSILMTISDINFSLCRHSLTKINELKQMLSISSQVGIDLDGFIYNAYERPSSYYGYYGLYGNYAYQYYAKKYLYDAYVYEKNE